MAQQLAHHVLEHLVPHRVAVTVVDPLEVIDVDIDEGERHLAELPEQLFAAEPVEGPGQGIVAGLLLGAPVLLAQARTQGFSREARLPGLAQPIPEHQVLDQEEQHAVDKPPQQQIAIEVPRLAPAPKSLAVKSTSLNLWELSSSRVE